MAERNWLNRRNEQVGIKRGNIWQREREKMVAIGWEEVGGDKKRQEMVTIRYNKLMGDSNDAWEKETEAVWSIDAKLP